MVVPVTDGLKRYRRTPLTPHGSCATARWTFYHCCSRKFASPAPHHLRATPYPLSCAPDGSATPFASGFVTYRRYWFTRGLPRLLLHHPMPLALNIVTSTVVYRTFMPRFAAAGAGLPHCLRSTLVSVAAPYDDSYLICNLAWVPPPRVAARNVAALTPPGRDWPTPSPAEQWFACYITHCRAAF